jgi:RNA polymerase sigma-70 factor (ECF subfamily)
MQSATASHLRESAELSDGAVVDRVLSGETALFELLMRRHNQRLYRAARAILRDDAEAEDVMQQAYVNAYRHLRQFDGRAAFSTWLMRIAVNEAVARARRRGRYAPLDSDDRSRIEVAVPTGSNLDPERLASSREIGALIEAAVDRLPDGQREVFVLRQIEEMSTAEVAESLGINEAVVKTRLFRARAALRRDLTARLEVATAGAFNFLGARCDRIVAAVLARIS